MGDGLRAQLDIIEAKIAFAQERLQDARAGPDIIAHLSMLRDEVQSGARGHMGIWTERQGYIDLLVTKSMLVHDSSCFCRFFLDVSSPTPTSPRHVGGYVCIFLSALEASASLYLIQSSSKTRY